MATTVANVGGGFRSLSLPPRPPTPSPFATLPVARCFHHGRSSSSSRRGLRAMVQQHQMSPGPSANHAKEMERLSAKESLLLALKDSGGFESLVGGKTTEMQRIDVSERIVGLERLNPTPRPTMSPFLECQWNFEWFGGASPGLLAARVLFERSPATLATLSSLNMLIKDGYSKVTAKLRFLSSIEAEFLLTTKLSVEGPIRMKEEYIEGTLEVPTIRDEAIPEQLKGTIGQAAGTLQQLPVPIKDALSNGLKVPLGGTFQRLLIISYLDEEILIVRDASGAADVLTRLDGPPEPSNAESIPYYES